jgi:hypothetical protein
MKIVDGDAVFLQKFRNLLQKIEGLAPLLAAIYQVFDGIDVRGINCDLQTSG